MLQYPINFYPDGNTIDPSGELAQRTMRYTFKGDVLLGWVWKIYDYDTEEKLTLTNPFHYATGASGLVYNNETITDQTAFADTTIFPIDTEHRYVIQCCLCQGTSLNDLIHDRFVLRGELADDYDHSVDLTNMLIEDKINLIYEWDVPANNIRTPITVFDSSYKTLGTIVMKIGNEQCTIASYNYNTGEVVINAALTEDYPKGTPYQLYANYLITQQYFFKTAPTPSFTNLQAKWAGGTGGGNVGVNFTANYTLNEYNPLKYYTITLEKQVGDDIDGQPRHYAKIYETEKKYSQKIECKFVDDYDVYDEEVGFAVGNSNTRRYLFTVKGVLQNGMTISAQLESQAPERLDVTYVYRLKAEQINTDEYHNAVKLTWAISAGIFGSSGGVRIYRYDMNAEDVIHSRVLLASAVADDNEFIDITASTHSTYRYVLIPFQRVAGDYTVGSSYNPAISNEITTNLYGYTITELKLQSTLAYNGKPTYHIGESWHLRAEIDDTTITQNTDKVLHVGYGKYSSVTHTATNYMSGTFTGSLVQADCLSETKWRDDIGLVNAWRDFITRDTIYLLRSQKGDVWVVNVVDNPTTTYEEGTPQISTSVSFNWAECASIDDITIASGNVW